MYLDYLFHYGPILAALIALACAGLSCWRLSKVLRERSFVVASWAMGGCVVLESTYYLIWELYGLLPPALALKWPSAGASMFRMASLCFFIFFVAFIVGVIRRSHLAARKVAD